MEINPEITWVSLVIFDSGSDKQNDAGSTGNIDGQLIFVQNLLFYAEFKNVHLPLWQNMLYVKKWKSPNNFLKLHFVPEGKKLVYISIKLLMF